MEFVNEMQTQLFTVLLIPGSTFSHTDIKDKAVILTLYSFTVPLVSSYLFLTLMCELTENAYSL